MLAFGGIAQADCRQALALALDVSGSVDAREYTLQYEAIAWALAQREVRNALFSDPQNHVELLIYEWSGPEDQTVIIDWTAVRNTEDIATLQAKLRDQTRTPASPGTAIGSALNTGKELLATRAHCWQRTLDISGDGKSNIGPPPKIARSQFEKSRIVVNALVIGADHAGQRPPSTNEIGELARYFETNVITGTDAFVETALGFDGYATAMASKLERELRGLSLSALPGAEASQ